MSTLRPGSQYWNPLLSFGVFQPGRSKMYPARDRLRFDPQWISSMLFATPERHRSEGGLRLQAAMKQEFGGWSRPLP
jgi:hypothetical protein